ncbi:MAG: HdeD family acid-resistance protein [Nocardioides sp.]|uniref:HdeD family acid-resistance protein n=1 Tax=Nocardioides sp. TaxID=35761 RepID=UPI003EFCCD5B
MSGTDPDSIFDDTDGTAVRPQPGAAPDAAEAPASPALQTVVALLDASWKDLMLRGVLAVVFGVLAMAWPLSTVLAMVLLWGFWALADGIGAIWQAFHTRGARSRAMTLLVGVVALAAGVIALVRPDVTAVTLVWLLGIWFIVRAVVEVATGFTAARGHARALLVMSAVVDLILGLLLVLAPARAAISLSVLIGLLAFAWGLAFVALAVVVRRSAATAPSVTREH